MRTKPNYFRLIAVGIFALCVTVESASAAKIELPQGGSVWVGDTEVVCGKGNTVDPGCISVRCQCTHGADRRGEYYAPQLISFNKCTGEETTLSYWLGGDGYLTESQCNQIVAAEPRCK